MKSDTLWYLSEAHRKYADGPHRRAYLTMLWFAIGTKALFVKDSKYYFWWHVIAGRRC
jgi:hypothetical protein